MLAGDLGSTSTRFTALLLTLCIGILLGTTFRDVSTDAAEKGSLKLTINRDSQPSDSESANYLTQGFSQVAEKIAPSVVNISSEVVIQPPQRSEQREVPAPFREFFGDEFHERFFGPMVPQKRQSLGSGLIVDEKGYILTNHHVVAPAEVRGVRRLADKITVQLSTGKSYSAEVIGTDPESDLAVLRIEPDNPLIAARIGDSSALTVGDWVIAVGSPFGLDHTVTAGIISTTERVVPSDMFGGYVQTDAAINPGNSGGPLVNLNGEVVGINTFIATSTGNFAGVGFAVPSTVFVNSYNQLVTNGVIDRGWLGVSMNTRPMTSEMAEYFGVAGEDPDGIKDGDGVLVAQLIDEHGDPAETGPAAEGGIREGDVIVKFGDQEIESIWDLRSAVANTPPGESVSVTVVRQGVTLDFDVQLATRAVEREERAESSGLSLDEQEESKRPKEIGLEFRTLRTREAKQFELEDEEGVLILAVKPGGLADEAGLAAHQVITHVNGKEVTTAREFKERVDDVASGKGVVLRVLTVDQNRRKIVSYTSFVKP